MAFQNLLEGDCGGQNPLMKLGGHFSQDQAFRQDRVLPIQPPFDSECLVNDFLEERFGQNLQSFHMDALAEELREIDRFSRAPINQAPNVAQLASRETTAIWNDQFLQAERPGGFQPEPTSEWAKQFAADQDFDHPELAGSVPHFEAAAGETDLPFERAVRNPNASSSTDTQSDLWASQFEKTVGPPDSSWVQSFLHNQTDEGDLAAGMSESESKFQKFWNTSGDGEKWAEEFREDVAGGTVKEVIWDDEDEDENGEPIDFKQFMEKMWNQLSGTEDVGENWQNEFNAFVDPFKTYAFEEENPLKNIENPIEEGLRRLEAQDIPGAVLCFEAAVQAEPENPLAWQYLGTTQAKNEKDPLAIAALRTCLNLQPDNMPATMCLAVAYTNESYQNSACQMLRDWLVNNPKYKNLKAPPAKQIYVRSLLDSDFHKEVTDYYIQAANLNPVGEIDVDIQCALGILFNLNNDYDKAVDCFKAALEVVPTDYEMWNRLGATLANGSRSEEAVDAYYHALKLSPGFIRARYNLGITCINLGAYREAVEHFLSALNQQDKSTTSRGERGAMSDSIWSTLRLVISNMNMQELIPAVDARDLSKLNQEFAVK